MKKRHSHLEKQIRISFEESGMTIYRLAKESGVPQPVVSRFLSGKRGITLNTASKLVEVLGLELVQKKRKGKKKERK